MSTEIKKTTRDYLTIRRKITIEYKEASLNVKGLIIFCYSLHRSLQHEIKVNNIQTCKNVISEEVTCLHPELNEGSSHCKEWYIQVRRVTTAP
jgi:hypothetical protein